MVLNVLIGILFVASGFWIYTLSQKIDYLYTRLQRYSNLISQEDFEEELGERVLERKQEISALDSRIEELRNNFLSWETKANDESWGFDDMSQIANFPEPYASRLLAIENQQKSMIDRDVAIFGSSWAALTNQKSGDRLIKDLQKAILAVFNYQTKRTFTKVRSGNLEASRKDLYKSFRSLNRVAGLIGCSINEDYLRLNDEKIQVKYNFEFWQKESLELERQSRREERERRRNEEEIKRAEEDIIQYEEEKAALIREKDALKVQYLQSEEYRLRAEEYILGIQVYDEKIEDTREFIRGRKEGFIFVLSNRKSFGQESRDVIVYRICKTTTEKPREFINAMNRYVPYPFQIDLVLKSEDANLVVSKVYSYFEGRRKDKGEMRLGFFLLTFKEIKEALDDIHEDASLIQNVYDQDI
jgi:hypothetical protein